MKKIVFPVILLIQLLLLTGTLWADGVYIPDRAFRKLPEIPIQRAILSYKDGIETLIIESAVNAEGQSFGWIIPIPAEPTELTKVSTELLNVFASNTEPEIIHDRPKEFLIIFAIISLFFLIHIFLKKDFHIRFCWIDVRKSDLVVTLILGLFIWALLGPSLFSKLGAVKEVARIAGVDVKRQVDIGNYEVSVLKAARADDLNAWLDMNGFMRVPSAGAQIVEDYVKRHWVFVVAKLKRQEGGLSTPHPILVRFPVDKPVYPMKLTALAESNLYLRLFIVGDQRATLDSAAEKPKIEFSDRYSLFEPNSGKSIYAVFNGKAFHQSLSHPYAKEILWPGCVLTCYAGIVTPASMTDDYTVTFSRFTPYRLQLFSNQGAFTKAFSYMLIVWGLSLLVASLLVNRKGRMYVLTRIILPALCICIFLLGMIYLALPKVETTTASGRMSSRSQVASFQIWKLKKALDNYKTDTGEYPSTSQGLSALISNPGVNGWNGPYHKDAIPKDPWNNPYHYQSPAEHSHDMRGGWYIFKYGGYDLDVDYVHGGPYVLASPSDRERAERRASAIEKALEAYKRDIGQYPTTAQGLMALTKDPGVKTWKGPYVTGGIVSTFTYKSPGATREDRRFENYDLYSYGEDNEPGGVGESTDITSWSWQGDVPIPRQSQ